MCARTRYLCGTAAPASDVAWHSAKRRFPKIIIITTCALFCRRHGTMGPSIYKIFVCVLRMYRYENRRVRRRKGLRRYNLFLALRVPLYRFSLVLFNGHRNTAVVAAAGAPKDEIIYVYKTVSPAPLIWVTPGPPPPPPVYA